MFEKDFSKVLKKLTDRDDYIKSLEGQKVYPENGVFSSGPFLHQETENFSEQESAQFEVDNKRVFDVMNSIRETLKNIWRS